MLDPSMELPNFSFSPAASPETSSMNSSMEKVMAASFWWASCRAPAKAFSFTGSGFATRIVLRSKSPFLPVAILWISGRAEAATFPGPSSLFLRTGLCKIDWYAVS